MISDFIGVFIIDQPQQERAYSSYLELNLADVEPCVSGPKRYLCQYAIRDICGLVLVSFFCMC